MDHLRSKITDLTGIPLENLDVAHVKGNYPFDMHILEVSEELEWNPKVSSLEQWPWMIEDGSMIFYRCVRTWGEGGSVAILIGKLAETTGSP